MRRRLFIGTGMVLLAVAIVIAIGPRPSTDYVIDLDRAAIAADPSSYIRQSEARIPGIRAGLEKQIVWHDPQSRARTPIALVYLHGFSGSHAEMAPLPRRAAERLGANLYLARLTGHGRSGDAMAEATVDAWMNDAAEAVEIGRQIGDRVVVVGASTGAAIATVLAAETSYGQNVAALVLIAPNFALNNPAEPLLTAPWSRYFVPWIVGQERGFEPPNALSMRLWTTRYPSTALLPMAAIVKMARETDIDAIEAPALFIFSPADTVVDPAATENVITRFSAPVEVERVAESGDPANHVIAGDARSPLTTETLAARIADFVNDLQLADGLASREAR